MKVFVLILALAAVALGELVSPVKVIDSPKAEIPSINEVSPVKVVDSPKAEIPSINDVLEEGEELPSVLGYLVDVAIPLAKARKELEEAYFAKQRIAGGAPAAVGQYPYQAGLLSEIIGATGNGVCGASLVSHNRLITAAHCWFDGINQAWRLNVVMGSVFLFGSDGVRMQTNHVVLHPQWTPELVRNDVAMIYLPHSVPLSSTIATIALPSGPELHEDFIGSTAIASGFGLRGDSGPEADITVEQFLSHVTVPVISNSVCFRTFLILVQESNVCISGEGGRSVCRGDSGGPLVVVRNGRPILIGVTSFGSPLGCQANRPAAFARVTSFMDFFNAHIH